MPNGPRTPFKLNTKQKQDIENSVKILDILQQELIKAERAGIDIEKHREKYTEMRRLSQGLLREFG